MGTSDDILIIDSPDDVIVIQEESPGEITIVTPEPVRETRELTEETPEPSYSPDTVLLAQNQVNALALQTALTGLAIGLIIGLEVLKIWITSR